MIFDAPDSTRDLDPQPLQRRLSKTMLETVVAKGLLAAGDKVMVAVSGGKDSATLLDLLMKARRKSPVHFELLAFHLDQGQPGYDGSRLRAWLESLDVDFVIHSEDTYSTVVEQVEGTAKSYCGPCSRFRRGILYTQAEKLDCNKIALGHHREDSLETLLMNMLYGGRMQAMPASYRTDDDRFDVIRPLIECDEKSIAAYAKARAFPILPCNLCGSQDGLKRARVKRLLADLEQEIPDLRASMLNSLKNVRPSHLF